MRRDRRVLLVAPQPFYQDRGTPIAVRQVLEALGEIGGQVDVLTYAVGEDVALPHVRIFRAGNPFGVRTVPIGFSMRKVLHDVPLSVALARRLRIDHYSCIHAVEEAIFPALALARAYRTPVLYDMQSSLPEHLQRLRPFRLGPVHRLLERAERWALRRSKLVVCSAGLTARVRRLAPETPVLAWHFPTAELGAGRNDDTAVRRELGVGADAPIVLYSGNFEAYQGVATLIEAIPAVRAEVPDAVFVLVGLERERERGATLARADALVASGALRLVERRPRADMPRYLAAADILVSPRAYGDNLPLKVFEYLAAGRPIVATDIATHRTVLNEERALLVPPNDRGLADGIVRVARDPALAERLGTAGRAYAERHFGWSDFVHSVAAIYDKVEQL